MIEAIRSPVTSILTRATRRIIPEYGIFAGKYHLRNQERRISELGTLAVSSVSEKHIASIIRLKRISEVATTLAVTSN
jgi:hypothetical protein